MEELETLNFVFFWISNISVNTQIVKFFVMRFNKFVYTTCNNFYYLYDYNHVNKLRIRNSIRALDSKGRGIIGFKFQIKGRFSRKQKASSVSFRQGLMPLNTISAHIEYAYYVTPIENSAAIVKV